MTVVARALPLPATRPRPRVVANATLVGREDVTGTLSVFVVALDAPLGDFKPGQYVSVGVTSAGELVQRPYSIVSLGQRGTRVELFVRRLPDGRFSNLLWRQELGSRLVVGRPKGLFTLDESERRPRVMIGTGTGVAPLLAMLESLVERGDRTPTVLIHGASYHVELAYRARIEGWIDRGLMLDYRPTVSRPHEERNSGWYGRTGRAETQLVELLHEWPWLRAGGSVAYLCGNPDMIDACSAVMHRARFAARDIRVELFHPPTGGVGPM